MGPKHQTNVCSTWIPDNLNSCTKHEEALKKPLNEDYLLVFLLYYLKMEICKGADRSSPHSQGERFLILSIRGSMIVLYMSVL